MRLNALLQARVPVLQMPLELRASPRFPLHKPGQSDPNIWVRLG